MMARILVVFALMAFPVCAEEFCDRALVGNTGSELAYKMRGDRCEGIFKLEVNSEQIHLVGLFESFEPWDPADTSLGIEWTLPAVAAEVLHLRVRGLPQRSAYQMDTRVERHRERYEWPLEIVERLGLRKEEIGVLGWLALDGWAEKIYIPLRLSGSLRPARRRGVYTLLFIPEQKLQEVYVSVAEVNPDGGRADILYEGRPLEYGYYPAKTPIDVEISGLPHSGVYEVTLKAVSPYLPPMTYSLHFYHERSAP